MGINITVEPEKLEFVAGDIVRGAATLEVTGSGGTAAGDFSVYLLGKAISSVEYTAKNVGENEEEHETTAVQHQDFFKGEMPPVSFNGKAPSGRHTIDFSFELPQNAMSSMKEVAANGSKCAITYTIGAHLQRPGFLKFDKESEVSITVLSAPETCVAEEVIAGPNTQVVKKCCLFKTGSMSIGFRANRSLANKGENVILDVVARNDSATPVKKMCIEIVQRTEWRAENHKASKTRVIASIVVPGTELGSLAWGVQDNDRHRDSTQLKEVAQSELRELLARGAGIRHELTVPHDSLEDVDTSCISVQHTISLRLKTPTCVTDPETSTKLTVGRMSRSPTQVAEAAPTPTPTPPAYSDTMTTAHQNPSYIQMVQDADMTHATS